MIEGEDWQVTVFCFNFIVFANNSQSKKNQNEKVAGKSDFRFNRFQLSSSQGPSPSPSLIFSRFVRNSPTKCPPGSILALGRRIILCNYVLFSDEY